MLKFPGPLMFRRFNELSAAQTIAWAERWPNFLPNEIACRDQRLLINTDALDRLQNLRNIIRKPLHINSAYRSPMYNAMVGGAENSAHLAGIAFDIDMENQEHDEFVKAAEDAGFTGFGFYPGFIHIDTGRSRTWREL